MGAFIGKGDFGVWATNSDRDHLLDWLAEYRCSPGDTRQELLKSEAYRWMGCCIDLPSFFRADEVVPISEAELSFVAREAQEYGPNLVALLRVVEQIFQDKWLYTVGSEEAKTWQTA